MKYNSREVQSYIDTSTEEIPTVHKSYAQKGTDSQMPTATQVHEESDELKKYNNFLGENQYYSKMSSIVAAKATNPKTASNTYLVQ